MKTKTNTQEQLINPISLKKYLDKRYGFDINSRKRTNELANARRVFFNLLKVNTFFSLKRIGDFSNKDHATVLHSINTMHLLFDVDIEINNDAVLFFNLRRGYIEPKSDPNIDLPVFTFKDFDYSLFKELSNLPIDKIKFFEEYRLKPYLKSFKQ